MKRIALIFCFISSIVFAQQVTISPATFNVTDQITITVSFASTTCNTMGSNPAKVYIHSGVGTNSNPWTTVIGNWGLDDGIGLMTNNGNGTWSITLTPSIYFNLTTPQQSSVARMGMVFRNASGSQTLKFAPSCGDFFFNVGYFQTTLTIPTENSTTIIASGGSRSISASNTNGNANYNLKANGVSIDAVSNQSSYSFNHTNITSNQNYELVISQGTSIQTKKFSVIVTPIIVSQAIPSGNLEGINYDATDPTKATLVLDAPGKDFVYVAGSFNNWQPDNSYAMKKDVSTSKFWIELTGLTPGVDYTYQYWIVDQTPVANSPVMVKTADPYSTLVLSSFDDPWISSEVYPNLPPFPTASGQDREVTVLKTGQTPYVWSNATLNFVKPEKEKLVVYELLVRDFDAKKSYQNLIDKIDYFKNLKINAIELMPIMEYEGNESWGYNTAFHLANDKFYGTADKLREFIEICHLNGIAVILDVALNHAFGRNPMVRMWMNDSDGDGWGSPSSDNPYFNTSATHSYSVGNDFNHQQARTKTYVKRVIKQWIQEYKIDGFRWDLTKGFTQDCPTNVAGGQDACTNGYHQDRVDVLKEYADYSWSLDPSHYIIFEHLGIDSEEQQWANYKINESPSKGVMLWGKMTDQYNQLSMGYNSNNNITRMGNVAHGFSAKRVIGYPESHDEERLMYKNVTFGNNTNATHNVRTLNIALSRMSAIAAVSLLIPGPKMLWHFADLGYDDSIFTCNNGSVNTNTDAISGDCKLDTKPQRQWVNNWLGDTNRNTIYNNYAKIIDLKKNNAVFSKDFTINSGTTLEPKIYIYDDAASTSTLKNVVVLSNFNVSTINVTPNFPYTGTWYNLIDNTQLTVNNVTDPISIEAGGFRVYGNQPSNLSIDDLSALSYISLSPNPSNYFFSINFDLSKVFIYSITGQLVKSFQNKSKTDLYEISDLNSGLYLVKVFDNNNNEKTLKLIKQ
ncbi:alpha-amylase family glycosyl hydrolase [Flavobacterium sp.]|jgi:1,4-alpha-glucan branching enzyme|uniref:alpha-amylase family glycosyl hydrolase n=1 Tax=Flavobacterium sp. TaxID=239 RepID=UPI0037C024E9